MSTNAPSSRIPRFSTDDADQAEDGGEHSAGHVAVVVERVDEPEDAQQQEVDAGDQREREQRQVRIDERQDARDDPDDAGADQHHAELPHVGAQLVDGGHARNATRRGGPLGHDDLAVGEPMWTHSLCMMSTWPTSASAS